MKVRPLESHEWELFRELRLAALGDAPDAFAATLEAALAEPDATWQSVARRFAEEKARELLVAEQDGRAVGLVSAVARDGVGRIGAMWVHPASRGAGVARRLLEAACRALESFGCTRITLGVTETNARAIALYERFGFALTGDAHPLRVGSPLRELEMARPGPVRSGSA